MRFAALCAAALALLAADTRATPRPDPSGEAIRRGRGVFEQRCATCHGMKYLGIGAGMSGADAAAAFGKPPPDLSLMAAARGRGESGARYVVSLLLSFNETPERNSIFPNIAMPAVFSPGDPQARGQAEDVAAFLLYAADPSAEERQRLGAWVLGYMAVLVGLLYLVYRRTWRGLSRIGTG